MNLTIHALIMYLSVMTSGWTADRANSNIHAVIQNDMRFATIDLILYLYMEIDAANDRAHTMRAVKATSNRVK